MVIILLSGSVRSLVSLESLANLVLNLILQLSPNLIICYLIISLSNLYRNIVIILIVVR